MLGVLSFAVSIVAVIMSFFQNLGLPSFALGILAIIFAVISAYYKDKDESGERAKKQSRALEVGAIIISGATAVSYYVFLMIA